MDRPFTNERTKQDWINEANALKVILTDELIEKGVKQMPASVFAISGEKIIAALKARRDALDKYAADYYHHLARIADIYGSNNKELFEINHINDEQTVISIYKITKEDKIKEQPYYTRTFLSSETNEIRIYGLDKTDLFKTTGQSNSAAIRVRIIDPQGIDSMVNPVSSKTELKLGKKFKIDTLHGAKFDLFFLPMFSPPEYKVFENDALPLFTKTGVRISANIRYKADPFRKQEYRVEHLISANYGLLRKVFNVGYVGTFGRAVGRWDLVLKARFDAPALENFFGAGNETTQGDHGRNYFKTFSTRWYGGIGLYRTLANYHDVQVSVFYQGIKLKNNDGRFISEHTPVNSELFNTKSFAGIETGYHFSKTNNKVYPTLGMDITAGAGFVQNLSEKNSSFSNLNAAVAFYLPLGKLFTVATRAGGTTTLGEAGFYHLNK